MMKTCYICGHAGNYTPGGGFGDIYVHIDNIIECLSCEQYICVNKDKPCVMYDNGYFCVKCVKKCTSCDNIFHVDHLDTCKKCRELKCYVDKKPCLPKDNICVTCSIKGKGGNKS